MDRKFKARYSGSCLCGATFKVGDLIRWEPSACRSSSCPACAPAKAVKGAYHRVRPGGVFVRFDRHPETGAIVLAVVASADSRNAEVYRLRSGTWALSHCEGEGVFAYPLPSTTIDGWRVQCEPEAA